MLNTVITSRKISAQSAKPKGWWEASNITFVRIERDHESRGDAVAIADKKGKYGVEGKYPEGTVLFRRADGRAELMPLLGK